MKVRELLSDESKWCKGCLAVNSHNEKVNPNASDAV